MDAGLPALGAYFENVDFPGTPLPTPSSNRSFGPCRYGVLGRIQLVLG